MKIKLTPEQEDHIYYKRLKQIEGQIIRKEIDFDTEPDYWAALQAFEIVRSL